MSIQTKLLISILGISTLIFGTTVFYITINAKNTAIADAKQLADTYAREYSYRIESELNIDIGITRAMADQLLWHKYYNDSVTIHFLQQVVSDNKDVFASWVSFELNDLDPNYTLPYGRKRFTAYKQKDNMIMEIDSLELDGNDETGLYYKIKLLRREVITDPYFDTFEAIDGDDSKKLVLSVTCPLLRQGRFVGLTGIDLTIQNIETIMSGFKPFDDGYSVLFSNDGSVVSHPNDVFIGKSIKESDTLFTDPSMLLEMIELGNSYSFLSERDNQKYYITMAPAQIGNTQTPWSVAIVVPIYIIETNADRNILISLISSLIGITLLTFVIKYIASKISRPLVNITKTLIYLSHGNLQNIEKLSVKSNDEIGKIRTSVNELIDGLNSWALFAKEIGKGNYNNEFALLSSQDIIGASLLEMRKSLIEAQRLDNQAKNQSEIQNWNSKGIAMFNELMREHHNDINELSYKVISNLVKYLEANQGGIFIINEDNKDEHFLEMKAAYAYDRRKIIERRIEIGENIVGRSVLEKESTYMTDLPPNYMHITSGLGGDSPRSLLVSPMIFKEDVYGVIEIASFKNLTKHQIEFIEKIGEVMASTISAIRNNLITQKLLEISRQKTLQFESQQEEMRQNNEELLASQDELARKQHELEGTINRLQLEKIEFEKREKELYEDNRKLKLKIQALEIKMK